MKKKKLMIIGAVAMVCATHTAMAQFFTNDLTDAASVAIDLNENLGPDGIWSYTNDYALAQDGTTNSVLQGGAVLGLAAGVTNDTDNARSYLATVHSNYAGKSWTAHVAVETVNVDPKNYIFFGMGQGIPNPGHFYEPDLGEYIDVAWQSGNSGSKVTVSGSNGSYENTGTWRGDPGYDIWMHYNHINQEIYFEIDDWSGGRFSDVDITTTPVSTAGLTNSMSIYFGGNATMTFGDFYVHENDSAVPPGIPGGVYTTINTQMTATIGWNASGGATAYNVKRSMFSTSNFVTIASGLTNLTYTDTNLETNEIHYYVVSSTNQFGESADSAEVSMIGLPADIIGPASSYPDSNPVGQKDNLFDGDLDTFYDTTVGDSWAGLDFGAGKAQQVLEVNYVLRNWGSHAINNSTNATFQGANSEDFSDAVILFTVPVNVVNHPTVNSVTITNSSSFRYVRLQAPPGKPLFAFAELDIVTSENLQATTNGTPHNWLDTHYNVGIQFGGDYEDADLSDTDGDGALAWEEYVAGTIPTDSNSVLRITSGSADGSDFIVTWQSVEGKNYSVITNANLIIPNPGVAVSGLTGLDGETSVTSSIPSADTLFMQISVE